MAKALAKVQKKVSKKKKGNINSLHENSRDARKLRRAGARTEKLENLKISRQKANQSYIDRVGFFKDAVQGAPGSFELEEIHKLICCFLGRHDEDIAELKAQRRPGRPADSKEDVLRRRIALEDQEYNAGFWLPDMRDSVNVNNLRVWNYEWNSLSTVKFIRLARGGNLDGSSFPPKGQS